MSIIIENIKTIQNVLKDAGLYDYDVDGIAGSRTVDAVQAAADAIITNEPPVEVVPPFIPDGYVTANFNMRELTHSNTAVARKLSNKPGTVHEQNLVAATVNLFQPIRDILGQPMIINSGYRSPAVNKAVGGSSTSAHGIGFAIDFVSPKFGSSTDIAKTLVKELKARNIKFDQLILEFPDQAGSWIHIGYKNSAGQQRGQILTAKKIGGRTKYLSGIHA